MSTVMAVISITLMAGLADNELCASNRPHWVVIRGSRYLALRQYCQRNAPMPGVNSHSKPTGTPFCMRAHRRGERL